MKLDFRPRLFDSTRLQPADIVGDLLGITVGVVLPLAMAFAIASGVAHRGHLDRDRRRLPDRLGGSKCRSAAPPAPSS